MRKLFFVLFLVFSISYAQVPQKMSHRGTAYNTSGQVLSNTAINIRVKIFDASTSGTLVFQEDHNNFQTNQNGQYNIEIGNGTTQSAPFNSINWGSGQKWLEISIAPVSNPTSFVTGSSQLMSVPYALYSNTTNKDNSLRVVNNISELRNIVGTFGDVVYVKGHTTQGDGGEGNFIWRSDALLLTSTNPSTPPSHSIDNDGTIIQAAINGTPDDSGRWVRQYNGYIDIRFFGISYNTNLGNPTQRFQRAIDFAANNAKIDNAPTIGSTIFFPNGSYIFDKIILRNGISLKGDSMDKTIINSSVSADQGYTSGGYLFEIDNGPVQINISNFNFLGRDDNKGCFFFDAKPYGSFTYGGLTNSNFKNIKISRFKGHSIYLKGDNDDLLNQLLSFENVYVNRGDDLVNSLRIEGRIGQCTFINCGFSGENCQNCSPRFSNGTNVDIINTTIANFPSTISFINCTFADSDFGINIAYAENVTIDNCWFENVGIGVNVDGSIHPCKSINVINNRFTNASGFGSISSSGNFNYFGRCVNVVDSFVNISNNFVAVTDSNSPNIVDDFFVLANDYTNSGITLEGNTFSSPKLNKTSGIMSVIQNVVSNKIDCKKNKIVFINSTSTASPSSILIINFESEFNTGETIFVRANGGTITFNNQGNLFLTNKSSLTLNNGEAAVFTRIDNIYQLTSIIKATTDEPELIDSNWNSSVTFFNGVTNFDANSTLRYRKKNGVVFLDGAIRQGTTQTNGLTYTLLQLPISFRPSRKCSFTIIRAGNTTGTTPTSTVVGRVDIDTNGFVYGVNYSNIWSNLSGISFVVDLKKRNLNINWVGIIEKKRQQYKYKHTISSHKFFKTRLQRFG